ncbi:MAG: molybdopterin-dependent oxidoreductase [Chloroflexi bacterium]|nr:molybdopterin-dependent oxidoreductase [Chloroflexota bacterium]
MASIAVGEQSDNAPTKVKDDVWINSSCNGCYSACGIKVHRVNGVVVKIEGDPDFPHNLGRLCAKGNAGLIALYNPNRVKTPLKRTNPEKGIGVDPQWVEIGREEALDTVAAKLKETRENHPDRMGMCHFDTNAAPFIGAWTTAFGSPNGYQAASGYFCGAGLHLATGLTNASFHCQIDLEHCNYAILFGSQLGFGVGHCPNITTQEMSDARIRGMHLVVVDPVCNHAASKADEWVPIRPGTDAALALAMLDVMLNELGIYDAEFIQKLTNGPYLVGPDGLYIRHEQSKKPLVWDATAGEARPYDEADASQTPIMGQFTVRGQSCQPAFQVLKEHLRQYTPEKASEITTVPAQTIRRIAGEYAKAASIGATTVIKGQTLPFRPAATNMYRGAYSHAHATHHAMAVQLMNVVIGNMYVPGGHFGINPVGPWWQIEEGIDGLLVCGKQVQMGPPPYNFLNNKPEPPKSHKLTSLFPISFSSSVSQQLAFTDPEKFGLAPLDLMIQCRGNVMMTTVAPDTVAAALKNVGFIVSFANYLDETAEFADIVLPDAHYLERMDPSPNEPYTSQNPNSGYWYWRLRQPVVEPSFKAPHWLETLIELAERAGFLEDYLRVLTTNTKTRKPLKLDLHKKPTLEELSDVWLRTQSGDDTKGLEWFKEHGHVKIKRTLQEEYPRLALRCRVPLYYEHFLTAKGYVEQVAQELDIEWSTIDYTPLISWFPCPAYEPQAGGFELFAVNYTLPFHQYSITAENPWLQEITERHPYAYKIMINSETARRLGLQDGGAVWVEELEGRKVKGNVKVTECIHPEVVAIACVFGAWADRKPISRGRGAHFNSLLPFDLKHIDPISCGADACARVKVYPA